MVASALEFINIFRAENFNDIVLSMKSSDTAVMIEATRQLVSSMQKGDMAYPLHLGVTEAGEGEDGRIRSAAGIGALLAEGIGDTIRVSLSEDPEKEIPVARKIADFYPRGSAPEGRGGLFAEGNPSQKPEILKKINGPAVITNLAHYHDIDKEDWQDAGYASGKETGELNRTDGTADFVIASGLPSVIPDDAALILPYKKWFVHSEYEDIFPLFSPETFYENSTRHGKCNFLLTGSHFDPRFLKEPDPATAVFIFTFDPYREKYAADRFLATLEENKTGHSVILNPVFRENDPENLGIMAAALLGRYLNDRKIAGICLHNAGEIGLKQVTETAFSILQCTETRITRTMYLSCPTCGRTKFNLQEAVHKVKAATGHLKGLKIAVMGCIVNGPGEMAGADYGYVGAASGKVHIYRGMIPVLKNIPEDDAPNELLKLIEKDRSV